MLTKTHLLVLTRAFCDAEGVAEGGLSKRLFNDGKRLGMMRRTNSDIGTLRFARAVQWLSDNWTEKAEWPSDIPRPRKGQLVVVPPKALPGSLTTEERVAL